MANGASSARQSQEDVPISAGRFVLIALATWLGLAVATALILRITYAAFGITSAVGSQCLEIPNILKVCLPPIHFDRWAWWLKGMYLLVTLGAAIWIAWGAVTKPADREQSDRQPAGA